jgi:NAD+ synthase (glutamine-hydrolysing)
MASFFSPYSHEFVRLGACVPHVAVADPRQNADNVLDLLASGDKARIALMVFPELGISAYAIDDLLLQDAVLDESLSSERRCGTGGTSIIAAWSSIAGSC